MQLLPKLGSTAAMGEDLDQNKTQKFSLHQCFSIALFNFSILDY